jgi:hypothetical protein
MSDLPRPLGQRDPKSVTSSRHTRGASAVVAALALTSACYNPPLARSACAAEPSRSVWTVSGADGRIDGYVRDLKEDTPIGNLIVTLDGETMQQRTDAQGAFHWANVAEGRHLLSTSAAVYLAHTDTLSMPSRGGLSGTLHLRLPTDVLKHCELYHP